jgi:hypothetical protein
MFGVSWIDWLVLVLYLTLIAVIGVSAAKRVRNAASFFIGDRKFGKVMMMFFTFGTGTHSDQRLVLLRRPIDPVSPVSGTNGCGCLPRLSIGCWLRYSDGCERSLSEITFVPDTTGVLRVCMP